MQETKRKYLRCSKCGCAAFMSRWHPDPGYNYKLREFQCSGCDSKWFQRIPIEEQGDYIQ